MGHVSFRKHVKGIGMHRFYGEKNQQKNIYWYFFLDTMLDFPIKFNLHGANANVEVFPISYFLVYLLIFNLHNIDLLYTSIQNSKYYIAYLYNNVIL